VQLDRLDVQTSAPVELHEITRQVANHVELSGIREGICYVFSPHTTAGLTINENADPDVRRDMIHALNRLVPLHDPAYRHAEGNSAAHVKASMMGFSLTLPVLDGRLVLGTWQGIYLCEFDGPRRRQVLVSVQSIPSSEA
jgi:secondary thiamine-phosphate synthase enzyme